MNQKLVPDPFLVLVRDPKGKLHAKPSRPLSNPLRFLSFFHHEEIN